MNAGKALDGMLGGLRVLDIGHYIAGPYCARLMSALGASVIKVEPPSGDPCRRLGPFPGDLPHPEKGGLFHYLNAGKRGVTLDLKSAPGRDLLLRLIRDADVVVENFEPRVLRSLRLDYGTMREVNARVVLTSISNFGQTGPYRDYKADEIGIQAVSGLMRMAGEPGRAPLKKGGNFAQYLGAVNAFSATIAALFLREQTGEGRHVDLALAESYASIHGRGVKVLSYTGEMLARRGAHSRPYPSGAYPCADGYVVMMGPLSKDWWGDFTQMIGAPELRDARFASDRERHRNADELDTVLMPWLAERTRSQIVEAAQQHGLAAGIVATAPDLLESPQLRHRDFFREAEIDEGGRVTMPGMPYVLMGVDLASEKGAPKLGEDNESVFRGELGLSVDELASLAGQGVI